MIPGAGFRPGCGERRPPVYYRNVPIYEFRCLACGERFEELVDAGTSSRPCADCGSLETQRVLSAQAAPLKLAKSAGERRAQERKNATLRERTKADFKARRKRAREARSPGGGAGG